MASDSTPDNVKTSIDSHLKVARSKIEPHVQNVRDHLPDRNQVQGILAWLAVGLAVVTVGGVTLSAGGIFLAIATPILILLSPILVPVGGVLFVTTAIFVVVAGISLAAVAAVVWLYKYLKGEEPIYHDRVDAARSRIADTANDVTGWARDRVPQVQAARSA